MAKAELIQIYGFEGTKRCLNKDAISKILSSVLDMPVAIISMNGNTEKAFMLNYLISFGVSAGQKDWLENACNGTTTGIQWNNESSINTFGIWMWSEPVIIEDQDGRQIAALLMNTQGSYDYQTSTKDIALMFSLSVCMSSMFIYNVKGGFDKDNNMQFLNMLTEFSSFSTQDHDPYNAGQMFQELIFLMQDWQHDEVHRLGLHNRKILDSSTTEYNPENGNFVKYFQSEELTDVTEETKNIFRSVFTNYSHISAFLLPYSGRNIENSNANNTLELDFTQYLTEFVTYVFEKENIRPKTVYHTELTGRLFLNYIEKWNKVIASEKIPNAIDLCKSTTEMHLTIISDKLETMYRENIETISKKVVTVEEFQNHSDITMNHFLQQLYLLLPLYANINEQKNYNDAYAKIQERTDYLEKHYTELKHLLKLNPIDENDTSLEENCVEIQSRHNHESTEHVPLTERCSDLEKKYAESVTREKNMFTKYESLHKRHDCFLKKYYELSDRERGQYAEYVKLLEINRNYEKSNAELKIKVKHENQKNVLLQEQQNILTTKNLELEQKAEQLSEELATLNEKNKNMTKNHAYLQEQNNQQLISIAQLQNTYDFVTNTIKDTQDKEKERIFAHVKLDEQLCSLKDEYCTLKSENGHLQSTCNILHKQFGDLQVIKNKLENEKKQLNEDLDKAKQNGNILVKQNQELQNDLKNEENAHSNKTRRLKTAVEDLKIEQNKLKNLFQEIIQCQEIIICLNRFIKEHQRKRQEQQSPSLNPQESNEQNVQSIDEQSTKTRPGIISRLYGKVKGTPTLPSDSGHEMSPTDEMVNNLKAKNIICSKSVQDAMLRVDRANYYQKSHPFQDIAPSIEPCTSLNTPRMHAYILELLSYHLRDGARVLHVGSGSGYLAACFARMVGWNGRVHGIDINAETVSRSIQNINNDQHLTSRDKIVTLNFGDGYFGHPENKSFDAIYVSAASPCVPPALIHQLKKGGRLIYPRITPYNYHMLKQIDKDEDGKIATTKLMYVQCDLLIIDPNNPKVLHEYKNYDQQQCEHKDRSIDPCYDALANYQGYL